MSDRDRCSKGSSQILKVNAQNNQLSAIIHEICTNENMSMHGRWRNNTDCYFVVEIEEIHGKFF